MRRAIRSCLGNPSESVLATHGQPLAALGAAAVQHEPPPLGRHALPETVSPAAPAVVRLKRPLRHVCTPRSRVKELMIGAGTAICKVCDRSDRPGVVRSFETFQSETTYQGAWKNKEYD